jgi:hypothetical protein
LEVYFFGNTNAMMVDGAHTHIEFGGN